MKKRHMFITDLDGTLFRSDRCFSAHDVAMLEKLGHMGVTRVLATGRSIFSLERAISGPFPVDYLIFSTGLGIAHYPDPKTRILKSESLSAGETGHIVSVLENLSVDYMIQKPLPDNHVFSYRYAGNGNPDFFTRIAAYKHHCQPVSDNPKKFGPSSQVIVVVPGLNAVDIMDQIKEDLNDFNVIKTTSPFDGQTLWIEIFPLCVSKGKSAAWLAQTLGINRKHTVAVGNDYNDEDLLEWAENAFVVENGPDDLKKKFSVVSSNNNDGVSDAIKSGFYL